LDKIPFVEDSPETARARNWGRLHTPDVEETFFWKRDILDMPVLR
jgi:hypothetical protein